MGKIVAFCRQQPGLFLTIGLTLFFCLLATVAPLRSLFWDDAIISETLPGNLWDIEQWISLRYWVAGNHALYRPVISWSLAMNNEVGGALAALVPHFSPAMIYRIFNILLHAIACYILYLFVARFTLSRLTAVLATLLFGVHAFHTEAIGLAVNRSEILALIFGLLFLMQHQTHKNLWLTLLYLMLALGSKESALIWIAIALFSDVASTQISKTKVRQLLLSYPLYISLSAAWFMWHHFLTASASWEPLPATNPLLGASLIERLPSIFHAQIRYLQNLVFPEAIITNYHYPLVQAFTWSDPRALLGLLIFPLCAILLLAKSNWRSKLGQSVMCYGACQVPNSCIFTMAGPLIAERFAYPSSAFFAIFIATITETILKKTSALKYQRAAVVLFGGAIIAHAIASAVRLSYWSNFDRFSTQAAISSPKSSEALHLYASSLKQQNPFSPELGSATKAALDLFPASPQLMQMRGQYLIESSTNISEVCAGYHLLHQAFLAEPFPAFLPGLIALNRSFDRRKPATLASELQVCRVDFTINDAKIVTEATRAFLNARMLENSTKKEEELQNPMALGLAALQEEKLNEAVRLFEKAWILYNRRENVRAFLLSLAHYYLGKQPPIDIFAGSIDFNGEWKKYCASIGYTPSNACRRSFKIGLDGVPWHNSPLDNQLNNPLKNSNSLEQ